MRHCRQISLRKFKKFEDVAISFCNLIHRISGTTVQRIDFIFDCYFKFSPKSTERSRRQSSAGLELHEISKDTPIPVQEEKFWAHTKNKIYLQKFLRCYLLENGERIWPGIEILCSATDENQYVSNLSRRSPQSIQYLQKIDIEEADGRIMLHIVHIVKENNTKILISSYDTDVVVMALYYLHHYQVIGLQVRYLYYIGFLVKCLS